MSNLQQLMNDNTLLDDPMLPTFIFFLWIMIYLFWMAFQRIAAIRSRKVKPRYFVTYNIHAPDYLLIMKNHFSNLTEVPQFFFPLTLFYIATKMSIPYFGILTWAFVLLRIIHTFIHVGWGHVLARFLIFALSCIVLIILWTMVAIEYISNL